MDSPILGSDDGPIPTGVGVELPFDALMTLQHLTLDRPPSPDELILRGDLEMQETSSPIRSTASDPSPSSQLSAYSLSGLSIPSPSAFFASLANNARHTWHIGSIPVTALPPSSTTAEQFYKCPWNIRPKTPPPLLPPSSTTAEQFYQCPWNIRPVTPPPLPTQHIFELDGSAVEGLELPYPPPTPEVGGNGSLVRRRSRLGSLYIYPDHLVEEYSSPFIEEHEGEYDKAIQEAMAKNIDRTTDWLAMQTAYLASLRETNPLNDLSEQAACELRRHSSALLKDSPSTPIRRAVRFLDTETSKHEHRPVPVESVYYHAFQHIRSSWRKSDVFRHRLTRSDSIQSVRLCLPHEHLKRVKGEYHLDQPERPHPHRPISLMPGKEDANPDETPEQATIRRVERERQALEQMNARAWIIEATKYLSGGALLNSPARWRTIRTPKLGDIHNGRVRNPARVLDLGGVPQGDWAWHCAKEYPHAKVFTVTTEPDLIDPSIRGPHNHRRMHVRHLYRLPFPDHHFHAISARTLHSYLKLSPPEPENPDRDSTSSHEGFGNSLDKSPTRTDEYDACLAECLRILKPGGYLEFSLLDAEIVHPFPDRVGPLATKTSVEFALKLRNRGYDPQPSKRMLGRLREVGYDDIKRAWTFMPVGSPTETTAPGLPDVAPPPADNEVVGTGPGTGGTGASGFDVEKQLDGSGRRVEAVRGPVGSTRDVANVSGLVGSWAWEQWMMRVEDEGTAVNTAGPGIGVGGGQAHPAQHDHNHHHERLLEEVAGVLEEGKHTGAGWRCLRGWARKPLEMRGSVDTGGYGAGGGGGPQGFRDV